MTPSPSIEDGIPRCSPRCRAFRPGVQGQHDYSPPLCLANGEEWPRGRICLPAVRGMTERLAAVEAARDEHYRAMCDAQDELRRLRDDLGREP